VKRNQGRTTSTPLENNFCASSVGIVGNTTVLSPFFQSAGVATLCDPVNCKLSITRKISSKFLPVEAGYVMVNFTFLSGPIINTDLTVKGNPDYELIGPSVYIIPNDLAISLD